jgi:hypothetical protein
MHVGTPEAIKAVEQAILESVAWTAWDMLVDEPALN